MIDPKSNRRRTRRLSGGHRTPEKILSRGILRDPSTSSSSAMLSSAAESSLSGPKIVPVSHKNKQTRQHCGNDGPSVNCIDAQPPSPHVSSQPSRDLKQNTPPAEKKKHPNSFLDIQPGFVVEVGEMEDDEWSAIGSVRPEPKEELVETELLKLARSGQALNRRQTFSSLIQHQLNKGSRQRRFEQMIDDKMASNRIEASAFMEQHTIVENVYPSSDSDSSEGKSDGKSSTSSKKKPEVATVSWPRRPSVVEEEEDPDTPAKNFTEQRRPSLSLDATNHQSALSSMPQSSPSDRHHSLKKSKSRSSRNLVSSSSGVSSAPSTSSRDSSHSGRRPRRRNSTGGRVTPRPHKSDADLDGAFGRSRHSRRSIDEVDCVYDASAFNSFFQTSSSSIRCNDEERNASVRDLSSLVYESFPAGSQNRESRALTSPTPKATPKSSTKKTKKSSDKRKAKSSSGTKSGRK